MLLVVATSGYCLGESIKKVVYGQKIIYHQLERKIDRLSKYIYPLPLPKKKKII